MSSLAPLSDYHPLARESACDTNPAPSSTSICAKTATTAPIPIPHDDNALDKGPHEATVEDQGGPRVVAQSMTSHMNPAETRSILQQVLEFVRVGGNSASQGTASHTDPPETRSILWRLLEFVRGQPRDAADVNGAGNNTNPVMSGTSNADQETHTETHPLADSGPMLATRDQGFVCDESRSLIGVPVLTGGRAISQSYTS